MSSSPLGVHVAFTEEYVFTEEHLPTPDGIPPMLHTHAQVLSRTLRGNHMYTCTHTCACTFTYALHVRTCIRVCTHAYAQVLNQALRGHHERALTFFLLLSEHRLGKVHGAVERRRPFASRVPVS